MHEPRFRMRLHFQQTPWDVYAAVAYVFLTACGFLLRIGNPLMFAFVLFVPGYLLIATLFPADEEIRWIERLVLSASLSIAVVPLMGLLLNSTPSGIISENTIAAIVLFTAVSSSAAYWRRIRLPQEKRLSATLSFNLPPLGGYSPLEKVLTLALALSIVIAVASLAYLALGPRLGERFTEFYILGPFGNASDYPTTLNVSQPGSVIIGITNHESTMFSYAIRIDLVGVELVYNASAGMNTTLDINRTTWSWLNLTIPDGFDSRHPYTFQINASGLWKVQFFLFRGGDLVSLYREVHLYVVVR